MRRGENFFLLRSSPPKKRRGILGQCVQELLSVARSFKLERARKFEPLKAMLSLSLASSPIDRPLSCSRGAGSIQVAPNRVCVSKWRRLNFSLSLFSPPFPPSPSSSLRLLNSLSIACPFLAHENKWPFF